MNIIDNSGSSKSRKCSKTDQRQIVCPKVITASFLSGRICQLFGTEKWPLVGEHFYMYKSPNSNLKPGRASIGAWESQLCRQVWFWVPTCAAGPSGGLVLEHLCAHPGISSVHSLPGMFALAKSSISLNPPSSPPLILILFVLHIHSMRPVSNFSCFLQLFYFHFVQRLLTDLIPSYHSSAVIFTQRYTK